MGQRWTEASTILATTLIDAGSASYSAVIAAFNSLQSASIEMTISTASMVVITQQCSMDGITWNDPVNATLTAAGAVYNALNAASPVFVAFTPIVSPYLRLKVVPAAKTDISLKCAVQGDRA